LQPNGNGQDNCGGGGQGEQGGLWDPIEPSDLLSAGGVEEPNGYRGRFVVCLASQESDLAKTEAAVGEMSFESRSLGVTKLRLRIGDELGVLGTVPAALGSGVRHQRNLSGDVEVGHFGSKWCECNGSFPLNIFHGHGHGCDALCDQLLSNRRYCPLDDPLNGERTWKLGQVGDLFQ
jgi:hypothetical protein